VERLASVLHSAEVSPQAEKSITIEAEECTDVSAVPFGIDLRSELAFRLRHEQVALNRKSRGLSFPAPRTAALCFSGCSKQ
jgi:hypothetical protein